MVTNTTKHQRYRDQLHLLRAQLDQDVSQLPSATDPTDRAAQYRDIDVKIGLAQHEAEVRQQIDAALERVNAGTFGVCERCHAKIGARRLDALPYARYCVRCERSIEKEASI